MGYDILDANGNYPNPLANKGVYEIAGVRDEFSLGNLEFVLRSPFLQSDGSVYTTTTLDIKNIGGGIAGNSLGMLMWKARASNSTEFIIVQDEVTGGISAGAFTSKFAPQEIVNNFDTITRRFGSNTT